MHKRRRFGDPIVGPNEELLSVHNVRSLVPDQSNGMVVVVMNLQWMDESYSGRKLSH